MWTLCLTFWGNARLFSNEQHHFTFPLAMHECSSFSTLLPICAIVCLMFLYPKHFSSLCYYFAIQIPFLSPLLAIPYQVPSTIAWISLSNSFLVRVGFLYCISVPGWVGEKEWGDRGTRQWKKQGLRGLWHHTGCLAEGLGERQAHGILVCKTPLVPWRNGWRGAVVVSEAKSIF